MTIATELVALAAAGDREAFGELYLRYQEMVFGFVVRRVGDRGTAEDLTSETFVRALRAIGRYAETGRDPGAWLVTIARNLVLDHAKSGWRQRVQVTGEVPELGDPGACPEQRVIARERLGAIRREVARLAGPQRECLTLRFLDGYSVAETAGRLGRGIGATKALQGRACRELAGRLEWFR
ncbi:sigma-70 family RNA polymerase sigma factor [Longispora sp. K20-0274]|uniref:RNA polymerase sigma factor n=1 Tax=Longispora sp. K20-0274 TaxID=3088255 RepID=UPI00399A1473